MSRLSPLPAERAVQLYVVAAIGWLLVSIGVVVVVMIGTGLDGELGAVPLRAGLGVVMSLITLSLPVLVVRHRDDFPRVHRLRGQYVTAAVVTVGVCVAGALWFWWAALPGAVVAVVAIGLALTRPAAGPDASLHLDYDDPRHLLDDDGELHLMLRRPVLSWFLILTSSVVGVAVLVLALWLVKR